MIGTHTLWNCGPCFWCGKTTYRMGQDKQEHPDLYTRDHLIPKRLRRVGLQTVAPQLKHGLTVTCCRACNRRKGQRHPNEFANEMNLSEAKRLVINKANSLNARSNDASHKRSKEALQSVACE